MLSFVKNGMFNKVRVHSANHMSNGSPGSTFFMISNLTPSSMRKSRTLELGQSVARVMFFSQ